MRFYSFLAIIMAFVLLSISSAEHEAMENPLDQEETVYHLDAARYGPGSLKIYQCPSECARRCSRTQYKKPCLFFCGKCCRTCLCVPPGFYGNKGVCPCYNNWKTQRGGPKCP